jgi:CRISPR-associated protein Csd2
MTVVSKRSDFVLLFDVKDGNPNGDPDMANTPRFDPETFQGLVSDVAIKRKVRDWVFAKKSESGQPAPGYDVFVLQGNALESRQRMPYETLKLKAAGNKTSATDVNRARDWMCEHFFDVRSFGAVMSTTDFNCGQVRGPVQVTFARSFDRVLTMEHGITRVAYTREEKARSTTAQTEMGNKHTVAYGLYAAHGFINPTFAAQTGFTEDDQELLFDALRNMWDLDRSAARGELACRGLYVFEHESRLGNAPAHKLFERIQVNRKATVEAPRSFTDYDVRVDESAVPSGVRLLRLFE